MQKQQGATLVMCLVLIAACVLLSRFLIESTILQFREGTNYLDKLNSFNTAENTLQDVKKSLDDWKIPPTPISQTVCQDLNCVHAFVAISNQALETQSWWQLHALLLPSPHPKEMVEIFIQERAASHSSSENPPYYYQVLVRSEQTQEHSLVILKAVFMKYFDKQDPTVVTPAVRVSWEEFR